MSSTSEAFVQLAEQKEALRIIANRYLAQSDKLPVSCTLQDIIDVLNEYDEYSYMNAFFNSIEVFPDKDYSINDTRGHISVIRDYAFYKNTALKSVKCGGVETFGRFTFQECTNLERLILAGKISNASGGQSPFLGCISLKHISFPNYNSSISWWNGLGITNIISLLYGGSDAVISYGGSGFGVGTAMKALICTSQKVIPLGSSTLVNNILAASDCIVYVPSDYLSQYQSAPNWTTINASRPIQQIESNINSLRELGVDFSYTPYANKKWENSELVYDSSIGETDVSQ